MVVAGSPPVAEEDVKRSGVCIVGGGRVNCE